MAEKELEEWQLRQSKTFAKWVNMYLAKKGYEDRAEVGKQFGQSWDNGVLLMKLMNALYDVPMPKRFKKDAKTRVHKLDNVNQALKMLNKAEVKTTNLKQVNLLDGDFRMMCGMTWNIILDYNIKGISVEDTTAKQGLLIWCRKKTQGYKGVDGNINNFSKDWKDGNAFLALVDRHTKGLVDYNAMYDSSAEEKLDAAFTACEGLGIMRLLEVEDLTEVERPDEKSVMTYVSELFKLFSKEDIKENAAQHIASFLKFQRRLDLLTGDYESRFDGFVEWCDSKCNHFGSATEPEDQTTAATMLNEYKEYVTDEKPAKMVNVVDIQDLFANIQGELKVNGRPAYEPDETRKPEILNSKKDDLQQSEKEYVEMIRGARMGFISAMDSGDTISDERMAEFEKSFDVFDHDKSGQMNKLEFKAALSAIGIALNDDDCERVFTELCSDHDTDGKQEIDKQTYMNYVVSFFTTSDDADSIMKSLHVLGDPENVSEDMFNQPALSDEDREYLMSRAEDGSLASFIASSFAS